MNVDLIGVIFSRQICDNAIVEAFGLAAEIMSCGPVAVKACLATLRNRQEAGDIDLEVRRKS
jgi:hypothetical protein